MNSTAVAVDFVTDAVDLVARVYGAKATRRLCRLSTKSTVLNSTLSPACTGLYSDNQHSYGSVTVAPAANYYYVRHSLIQH